ncbi:MAG: YrhK family protein [Acidobacteria bacterium]|nr:YrhK family protein [Acidobacteriota bacterium]
MTGALPAAPEGWVLLNSHRFGPFVVRARFRRPDGSVVEWTSRGHRLGHALRSSDGPSIPVGRRLVPARTWWISALFAVGSACFALGSFPPYLDRVSSVVDGITFFLGSLCFTAASALCFLEAASAPSSLGVSDRTADRRLRVRPRSIDWWSSLVQLVGTVWFNVMTLQALLVDDAAARIDQLVWRPDVLGSGCFLVASYLAFVEERAGADRSDRDVSWWIVSLNLAGSVAFAASAVGAFTLPSTADVVSFRLDNGGTFVGALCFLAAAVLLVPEARSARRTAPTAGPNLRS